MSSAPSRSSTDSLSAALEAGVETIAHAIVACGRSRPVVLIDGRSGAGKTSLAQRLRERWPMAGPVQTVALDDLYPGWEGLTEGAEYVRERVLAPHRRGMVGRWRSWDWSAGRRAEEHEVDPGVALIVEGAGVLTRQSAALADVRVWVEAPDAPRRVRALTRDGDGYRPFWDVWAAQEDDHLTTNDPAALATVVVSLP